MTKNAPPKADPCVPRQTECQVRKSPAIEHSSCLLQFHPKDSELISPPSALDWPLPQASACKDPPNPSRGPCLQAGPRFCRRAHRYPSHDAPQNAATIPCASQDTPHSHSDKQPLPPLCESCCRIPDIPSASEIPADSFLLSPLSARAESLPPRVRSVPYRRCAAPDARSRPCCGVWIG